MCPRLVGRSTVSVLRTVGSHWNGKRAKWALRAHRRGTFVIDVRLQMRGLRQRREAEKSGQNDRHQGFKGEILGYGDEGEGRPEHGKRTSGLWGCCPSLSFLRKHRRNNRSGGVRPLNKYSFIFWCSKVRILDMGLGLHFRKSGRRQKLEDSHKVHGCHPGQCGDPTSGSSSRQSPWDAGSLVQWARRGPGDQQAQQTRLGELSDLFVNRCYGSGTVFSLFLSSTSSIIALYFPLF